MSGIPDGETGQMLVENFEKYVSDCSLRAYWESAWFGFSLKRNVLHVLITHATDKRCRTGESHEVK